MARCPCRDGSSTVRDQSGAFVVLRDETGAVQLGEPSDPPRPSTSSGTKDAQDAAALALTELISGLATGTFLTVTGGSSTTSASSSAASRSRSASLEIAAAALPETPIAADSGQDKRMDSRFLDLRTAPNNLIFRRADHPRARDAHLLDRARLHRGVLAEADGLGIRIQCRTVPRSSTSATRPRTSRSRRSSSKQMAQVAGFGKIFEIAPAFRADPRSRRGMRPVHLDRCRDQLDRLA